MVQEGEKWLWVKMWWNLWIQVVTGAYTWLRVVMGGFGVGTRWGGYGWFGVISNVNLVHQNPRFYLGTPLPPKSPKRIFF